MSVSQTTLIAEYGHLEKVHFLTDLPLEYRGENTRVFRYMQYPDLKLSLQNKNFAFMSPKNWEDKLEQYYWMADYSALNPKFKKPEFACLCVTPENLDDSAASWKMYCKEYGDVKPEDYTNNLVRLCLNFTHFLKSLNEWADKNDSGIYIAAVNYSYGQEEIKNLYRNSDFFPVGFDVEDFFRVLTLKRPNYSFEREIRIFVMKPPKGKMINDEKILLLEDFDITECVSSILVSPAKKEYKKVLNAEIVRNEIGSFFHGTACSLSYFVKNCLQFECDKCPTITPEKMENKMTSPVSNKTKYLIECSIETLCQDLDMADIVSLKIKGVNSYLLKDGSNVYNLFYKCENGKTTDNLSKIKSETLLKISNYAKIEKLVSFAFEKGKNVVLEFDEKLEKVESSNECLQITAITVKS